MNSILIDPIDPLIVRDARPFSNTPGARAVSLPFPPPSVIAGGIRTRIGTGAHGQFNPADINRLKALAIHGPVLVQLDADGAVADWFLPAPADALLLQDPPAGHPKQDGPYCYQLRPLAPDAFPTGQSDLPDGLRLVGSQARPQGKGLQLFPSFWSWRHLMQRWLVHPAAQPWQPARQHWASIQRDLRTHVQIKPSTLTAADGMLFQTRGLSFRGLNGDPASHFALLAVTDDTLDDQVAPLGGERRLMHWCSTDQGWPAPPQGLFETIRQQRRCRIILATPACWSQGYRPQALPLHQLRSASIVGIANSDPAIHSGWDLHLRGPKPLRRLAPAGTVLFVKLDGDDQAVDDWCRKIWFAPISDTAQDCLDGFGLAVPGAWTTEEDPR